MKQKKIYVNNRRNEIIKLINENKSISVEELSNIFEISPITIRRDLQYLEDNNKIIRYYGGVKAKDNQDITTDITEDNDDMYKELLAKYATTFVNDYDNIFINSSSTSFKMLKYINKKHITVITNNAKAINEDFKSNVNVIITGGEIRHPKEVLVGDYAIKTLQNIYAKKAFIGCSGISLECGMTTANMNEVNINKMMIEHSTIETYFIADHTKICKNSGFISCPINQIKNLITDEKVPKKILDLYRKRGINVHVVKMDYI